MLQIECHLSNLKKRAAQVNANRNLDILASLKLDIDDDDGPQISREGIGSFASMLCSGHNPVSGPTKQAGKPKHPKYAEKCMYAELLELARICETSNVVSNVPPDLQTNWIALSPVPRGKRCLAVAHVSHGNPGFGQTIN
jgi:snurportin-1